MIEITRCKGYGRNMKIKCPNGFCKYCCIDGHYKTETEGDNDEKRN